MVTMLLALCSLPWSAGPGCSSSWPIWTRRVFHVDFPFRAAKTSLHGPALSEDHREFAIAVHGCRFTFPSWLRVAEHGGRGPCCAGRAGSLPCRDAEASSHGSACLANHRDFAVAVRAGWSMSLLCRSSWFPGAVVKETAEISQLLLLRNRSLPLVLALVALG